MKRGLSVVLVASVSVGVVACAEENPQYCSDVAPCPTGQSCSVQHECQAGFTLDETAFFFDGTTYWVASASPSFTGSSDAPNAIIVVLRGTEELAQTTIAAGRWKLQLPALALTGTSPTALRFVQRSQGKEVEIARSVAVDATAPVARVSPTTTLDEANDVIAFENGVPVHTHAGSPLALDGTQEPLINRYAHLLHLGHPLAREAAPNPLAIKLAVQAKQLDLARTRYRIVTKEGVVVADWLPATVAPLAVTDSPANAQPGFEIAMQFDKTRAPALTNSGAYCVEFSVVDWAQRESLAKSCLRLRLLPPPLQSSGPTISTRGPNAIGSWDLAQGAPVSTLAGVPQAALFEFEWTNNTPEPAVLNVVPQAALTFRLQRGVRTFDKTVSQNAADLNCDFGGTACYPLTQPRDHQAPDLTIDATRDSLQFVMLDANDSPASFCQPRGEGFECTLPARTTEAVAVRLVARVGNFGPNLFQPAQRPRNPSIFGEYEVDGIRFTGMKYQESGCRTFVGNTCTLTETVMRHQMVTPLGLAVWDTAAGVDLALRVRTPSATFTTALKGEELAPTNEVRLGKRPIRYTEFRWRSELP